MYISKYKAHWSYDRSEWILYKDGEVFAYLSDSDLHFLMRSFSHPIILTSK